LRNYRDASNRKGKGINETGTRTEMRKIRKYWCTVCDYIYDPEEGDFDSIISPGISFEELPDDWVCPICGASKEDFEEVE